MGRVVDSDFEYGVVSIKPFDQNTEARIQPFQIYFYQDLLICEMYTCMYMCVGKYM